MLYNLRQSLILGAGILTLVVLWLTGTKADSPAEPATAALREPATRSVSAADATDSCLPPAPSSPLVQGSMGAAEEDVIGEILTLRHHHQEIFRGTLLDEMNSVEADQEFLEALQKVVRRQGPRPNSDTVAVPVSPRTEACEAVYFEQMTLQQQIQCQSSEAPLPGEPSDAALAIVLRQAGRLLDRKANDLEDDQQYVAADQLRELSGELRRQARQWTTGPIPPPLRQAERRPLRADTATGQ